MLFSGYSKNSQIWDILKQLFICAIFRSVNHAAAVEKPLVLSYNLVIGSIAADSKNLFKAVIYDHPMQLQL